MAFLEFICLKQKNINDIIWPTTNLCARTYNAQPLLFSNLGSNIVCVIVYSQWINCFDNLWYLTTFSKIKLPPTVIWNSRLKRRRLTSKLLSSSLAIFCQMSKSSTLASSSFWDWACGAISTFKKIVKLASWLGTRNIYLYVGKPVLIRSFKLLFTLSSKTGFVYKRL